MKFFFYLLLSLSLFACADKSVSLPQLAISGETEIQNHSEIWVFKEIQDNQIKADVNKNSLITTTNWILNIDKQLPLSEVIPVFQMVKAKRGKKSIHSAEGMHDYLSYANILDKNISVFPIDHIQYIMLSKEKLATLNNDKICKNTINFSRSAIFVNNKKHTEWRKEILNVLSSGCVQLQFSKDLNYQKYMEYRLSIQSYLPDNVSVETTEYIYK